MGDAWQNVKGLVRVASSFGCFQSARPPAAAFAIAAALLRAWLLLGGAKISCSTNAAYQLFAIIPTGETFREVFLKVQFTGHADIKCEEEGTGNKVPTIYIFISKIILLLYYSKFFTCATPPPPLPSTHICFVSMDCRV